MACALNVTQRRMLQSVRYQSRDLPFTNPTMNELRRHGLVEGVPTTQKNGRLSVNYRWSITEAGIAANAA